MRKHQILIIDDDANSAKYLARILNNKGYSADYVCDADEALGLLRQVNYELLLIDFLLPRSDGLTLFKQAREIDPEILGVFITAHGSITLAVDALKAGASDFLEKPVVPEKLLHVLNRVFEERRLKDELLALKADLEERYAFGNIVGKHPSMQKVFRLIQSLAAVDSPVLINGETGTGKDLVARAIHINSRRKAAPFVAINCASIPEALLESELFGYERGAFTGAVKQKPGKLERAQGGSVFLDEIGDMPLLLQGKLLRALQEKSIERLGGNEPISLDVRIISATNRDLQELISRRRFRADLFYRINVVPVHLPPLRDRQDDIPLLADHFLTRLAQTSGIPKPKPSSDALRSLMEHSWPGNVRELENVLERAMILSGDGRIDTIPFHESPDTPIRNDPPQGLDLDLDKPLKANKESTISLLEKTYLTKLLERYQGSVSRTAAHAQIDVRTVLRKMKQYDLDKSQYKT